MSTYLPYFRLGRASTPALLATLLMTIAGHADVTPHALFAPHVVLQRGMPIPVWGKADPGENVTVAIDGATVSAVADTAGHWIVRLPARPAGGPFTLTLAGKNRIVLEDVWVGEVWLASGQSNMERQLGLRGNQQPLVNWENEVASADYPQIRHFAVDRKLEDTPQTETKGKWDVCTPLTAPNFTAVGYYFARDLHRELHVAVGIIHSSWGGTPAESWTSREAIAANAPELIAAQATAESEYPAKLAAYQAAEPTLLATWNEQVTQAKAAGKPEPGKPSPPADPLKTPKRPACLYNGMIRPLQPFAIRGVLWYQGESNSGSAAKYRVILSTLIKDWRAQWATPDLPFLIVQIAPYRSIPPELREAQLLTCRSTPHTALIVTTDVGDANDIHPNRKEPVGARLALAARTIVYGQKIVSSGPVFTGFTAEGSRAVLRFTELGGGLVAKDGPLRGFTVSGDGKLFVPAEAAIVGDTVVLTAANVTTPVAVRYGWSNVPDVNLVNAAGLPASPFRSDEAPILPTPKP